MRSSTSASDVIGVARATRLLLMGCAIVALGAEVGARVALDRASKMQQRVVAEYRAAQQMGGDRREGRAHVLVVGNSLLDEGVQFDRVRTALGDQCDARRLVVEQT